MSRRLDAVIFGATGFTGKYAVEHAVEVLKDFRWGIAGRNKSKLETLLKVVGAKVGKDLSDTPIIVADVDEIESIELMAASCKIVLNCCGPYRLYGEAVVKACVEAGTHHVDVTAEPQYIDSIQLKYHELAKEKGAYIVPTCAFESVPAEMGVNYVEQNFPGTINSIEMYLENSINRKDKSSRALFHYATWESGVYMLQHWRESLVLQKQINEGGQFPKLKPKLRMKLYIHKPKFLDSYCLPFPTTDRTVVKRSQRLHYEQDTKRPIQFETYMRLKSLLLSLFIPLYCLLLFTLTQFSYTRKLLLRHPSIFTLGMITHRGPTEENMNAQQFSMTFKAKGWASGESLQETPAKELLGRVSGSNPFYGFASVSLLCCAKTILRESEKMPNSGGVIPPGFAFANTSLIEELNQHPLGLKFELLN